MCNVFVNYVMFCIICNVCNRTLTVMCPSRQTGRSTQRRNTKSWWQRKAQTTRKKCNPARIISLLGVYFGFIYFVEISRLVSPEGSMTNSLVLIICIMDGILYLDNINFLTRSLTLLCVSDIRGLCFIKNLRHYKFMDIYY